LISSGFFAITGQGFPAIGQSFPATGQRLPVNKIGWTPDTTLNNKLKLLDPASVRQNLGDQNGKLIDDSKASRVQFANSSNSEYLILYHLAGSNANSFNEFEIGNLKAKNKSFKTTAFASFSTESGIQIGMGKDALITIKGKEFTTAKRGGYTILRYSTKIGRFGSGILQRYNMPIYEAEYSFSENKLVKFIFGFPDL